MALLRMRFCWERILNSIWSWEKYNQMDHNLLWTKTNKVWGAWPPTTVRLFCSLAWSGGDIPLSSLSPCQDRSWITTALCAGRSLQFVATVILYLYFLFYFVVISTFPAIAILKPVLYEIYLAVVPSKINCSGNRLVPCKPALQFSCQPLGIHLQSPEHECWGRGVHWNTNEMPVLGSC